MLRFLEFSDFFQKGVRVSDTFFGTPNRRHANPPSRVNARQPKRLTSRLGGGTIRRLLDGIRPVFGLLGKVARWTNRR